MEATIVALRPAARGINVKERGDLLRENGESMAIKQPNNRFFHRAFRLQDSAPPATGLLSFASADSCTMSTAEHFSLEQAIPPVNQARWPIKLLGHLGHLRETNDLFGNVAKSQSEDKGMSRPLKVFAEVIDPAVAFFELGPCDIAAAT